MVTDNSSKAETGQLTDSAAEIYEKFFVPALFGEWAPRLCDATGISTGGSLLDVACGTGVVAREAKSRVGGSGAVTGLDRNNGMLDVAASLAPDIIWQSGVAEELPFEDGMFDAVTCQFGLMFFDDRKKALIEMWRVLRPGGRLVVATWDTLAHTPGYDAMAELLDRLFGAEIAAALKAPFILGDPDTLMTIFTDAGISDPVIKTRPGLAHFPGIEGWVYTDIKGWTLSESIDETQYQRLLAEAKKHLARFTTAEGSVEFSSPAHIVIAEKRG
ncbi:MAG: class I SAM-dependent methyltransferase [Sneathiella sp.]|nr:class I SAM-dependent methyltransferase [Sneathiella sp.]